MLTARSVHRSLTLILVLFVCYIGATGSIVQLVDLRALLTHQPATSPDMEQIRESINGTDDFAVIASRDYAAQPLPATMDYDTALKTALAGARAALGASTLRYLEFRAIDSKPVAIAASPDTLVQLDPSTGAVLSQASARPPRQPPVESLHRKWKWLHRYFSDQYLWINCLIGLGLLVQIVTGVVVYFRLLAARSRMGRRNPFWSAASWWRGLHRGVAIVAAALLILVAVTGTWLSYDSLMLGRFMASRRAPGGGFMHGPDVSAPLTDAMLPGMLHVTLAAQKATDPSAPIKVLRLRSYAGMEQGVVVAGTGDDTSQFAYDAATGRRVSETEPGYPKVGFPFGWQIHETLKRVHRGDYFGLPGRFLDLFAGLSMVFLSVSGIVMYCQMFVQRRRTGRGSLFWN